MGLLGSQGPAGYQPAHQLGRAAPHVGVAWGESPGNGLGEMQ